MPFTASVASQKPRRLTKCGAQPLPRQRKPRASAAGATRQRGRCIRSPSTVVAVDAPAAVQTDAWSGARPFSSSWPPCKRFKPSPTRGNTEAEAPQRTWPCQNCGATFNSSEAIRVRSAQGRLVPIHTCMLRRVEFWFDFVTRSYLLVTPFSERPGEVALWWGCDDPQRMGDYACATGEGGLADSRTHHGAQHLSKSAEVQSI